MDGDGKFTLSKPGDGPAGLVRRYREALMRYFSRRGVPHSATEDLAQDCFMRLFALKGRDHIENEEAYLFQTASSVFTDYVRRAHSRQTSKHVSIDLGGVESEPSEAPGADRVLEGKEAVSRLKVALGELKPRTREIFLLNRLDGLTYTQIAVRFGITPSAIEKHMMRVLAHLNERLEDLRP